MGLVIPNSKVSTIRRQANRKHPERDSADRYRAIPGAFVSKGKNGDVLIPLWALQSVGTAAGNTQLQSVLDRLLVVERQLAVLKGYAAPTSDRPMTPVPKELVSEARTAVSVPGNEAERLTPPDVSPKRETVLLLPAPSNVVPLNQVRMPVQPAANDEAPVEVVSHPPPLPTDDEGITTAWLESQFGFSPMEQFRVLDREFHRRNKSALKTHGMTYTEIRIKRKLATRNMEVRDGRMVHRSDVYFPSEDSKYKEWSATAGAAGPTRLSLLAFLAKQGRDQHRAYKRGMAFTPEAYRKRTMRAEARRKMDIIGRLDGAKFMHGVRFAMVDSLAYEVNNRTSASQLKAAGLWFRDVTDRVRRVIGVDVPDRGKAVRERAEREGSVLQGIKDWFTERKTPSDGGPPIPHPADFLISQVLPGPDEVPVRELIRGYQRAGIGH